MAHSCISCVMYCVFSTKNRTAWIDPELKERLYPYFGGIAKTNRMKMLMAGGTEDHVHLLLSLSFVPIPKALQLLKGGASKWIHDTFPGHKRFAWQEGYGAFSVSASQIHDTANYIQRQEEHHRKKTFKEEFLAFLKKHEIEYDERYTWG